jgi:hypothetical protein
MTPEDIYHQRWGAELELEVELQHTQRDLWIANQALEHCRKQRNKAATALNGDSPSEPPVYHAHTTDKGHQART